MTYRMMSTLARCIQWTQDGGDVKWRVPSHTVMIIYLVIVIQVCMTETFYTRLGETWNWICQRWNYNSSFTHTHSIKVGDMGLPLVQPASWVVRAQCGTPVGWTGNPGRSSFWRFPEQRHPFPLFSFLPSSLLYTELAIYKNIPFRSSAPALAPLTAVLLG